MRCMDACVITGAIKGSEHVVSGDISCGMQYHFTMETQVIN